MSRARRPLASAARPSVVRLSVLAMLAAVMHMSGVGNAAPPPVADRIASVVLSTLALPQNGPNNPGVLVAQDVAFDVTVAFADATGARTPSYTRDTTVTLSVVNADSDGPSGTSTDFADGRTLTVEAGS